MVGLQASNVATVGCHIKSGFRKGYITPTSFFPEATSAGSNFRNKQKADKCAQGLKEESMTTMTSNRQLERKIEYC